MTSWSQDDIQRALAQRAEGGSAVVTLHSPRDAKLFRAAIYNYARKHNLDGFTARLSGCEVILEPKSATSRPLNIFGTSTNANASAPANPKPDSNR